MAEQRAVILTKPRLIKIADQIIIDSCRDETHTLNNTITDHPVEAGSNISDHVRPEPEIVTLTCFVSNTPLSREQKARAVKQGSVQFETSAQAAAEIGAVDGRGKQTFDKLKKLRDAGTLVKIVTTLRDYGVTATSGMVIQSLTIPRNAASYDGLEFSITFKQIRIVRNKQTQVRKSKDTRAPKKVKTGAKVPTPNERKKTGWASINDTVTNGDNKSIAGLGKLFSSQ